MQSKELMVDIVCFGDDIFFVPKVFNATNDIILHRPFPHIRNQSSNADLGRELLKSFDLARQIDIDGQCNDPPIYACFGLETLSALLKKSKYYSFSTIRGENIILERGKRKRGFIEGIPTYTIPLTQAESDIEEFGRKVRDTLHQTI